METGSVSMGETLVQIRIELGRLGEKMDQLKDLHKEVKAVEKTADESMQRVKVTENRLKDIEAGQRWLWRTIGSGLILGLIGLVFTFFRGG